MTTKLRFYGDKAMNLNYTQIKFRLFRKVNGRLIKFGGKMTFFTQCFEGYILDKVVFYTFRD